MAPIEKGGSGCEYARENDVNISPCWVWTCYFLARISFTHLIIKKIKPPIKAVLIISLLPLSRVESQHP